MRKPLKFYDVPEEFRLQGYSLQAFPEVLTLDEAEKLGKRLESCRDSDILINVVFMVRGDDNGEYDAIDYTVLKSELDQLNADNCPYCEADVLRRIITLYERNQDRGNWSRYDIFAISFHPIAELKYRVAQRCKELQERAREEAERQQQLADSIEYLSKHVPRCYVSPHFESVLHLMGERNRDCAVSYSIVTLQNEQDAEMLKTYFELKGWDFTCYFPSSYPQEILWQVNTRRVPRGFSWEYHTNHALISMDEVRQKVNEFLANYQSCKVANPWNSEKPWIPQNDEPFLFE